MKSSHALSGAATLLFASSLLYGQSLEPDLSPPSIVTDSEDQVSFDDSMVLATDEDPLSGLESDCEPVPLYSARFALDFMLADFEINAGAGTYWTRESLRASRSEFEIESIDGYGVRVQSLSLEQEWDTDYGSLETRIATFYIDGYRRFVGEQGELLLGGGLAFGSLKLESPYEDSVLRFNGLGASLAGEGFYPLLRFKKTEFGVTGHARLAALAPFDDNFGNRDTMLVDELGVGLELRHRWGKHEDKLWFVRAGRDYQHWSDISAPFNVDQRIEATSVTVGFAW